MKTLLIIALVMLMTVAGACERSGGPESGPEDLQQPAALPGGPSAAVDAPVGQAAPTESAPNGPEAPAASAGGNDQGEDVSVAEANEAVRPLRFSDVTMASGVTFVHHPHPTELMQLGAGIVVLDFNGDGLDDMFMSESAGPNSLYRNVGDGTFVDDAGVAGVDDPSGRGNGGCAADYDNDGDQDLFVTNFGPSRLFRNGGDGTFVDVASSAGIDESNLIYRSTGCAWGDYDRDGYLDLIVVRHLLEFDPMLLVEKNFASAVGPLVLYHSNGDGTFDDVTTLLGDTSAPNYDGSLLWAISGARDFSRGGWTSITTATWTCT